MEERLAAVEKQLQAMLAQQQNHAESSQAGPQEEGLHMTEESGCSGDPRKAVRAVINKEQSPKSQAAIQRIANSSSAGHADTNTAKRN